MGHSPLRLGLLGLGRAGTFHRQSLQVIEGATLTCVHDKDMQKAIQIAQQHDCDVAESTVEMIQRPDIDAVIVATPTDLHFGHVQQSLEAGKPTLTEKPLGRHLHEIDACFDTAMSQGVPLLVAFQRRFDPSFASLVDAVKAGAIGQLQFVRSVSRDNPTPSPDYIRISGGIFHDCMVHDLDMVTHIVGQVPSHVHSFASSFIDTIGQWNDFDNVVTTLTFPSGIHATIDINRQSAFGYDQRIEAFGGRGDAVGGQPPADDGRPRDPSRIYSSPSRLFLPGALSRSLPARAAMLCTLRTRRGRCPDQAQRCPPEPLVGNRCGAVGPGAAGCVLERSRTAYRPSLCLNAPPCRQGARVADVAAVEICTELI